MEKAMTYTIQPKRFRRIAPHSTSALMRSSMLSARPARFIAAMMVSAVALPHSAFAVADPSTITTVSGSTSSMLTAPGHLETTEYTNRGIISAPNVDVLDHEA